MPAKQDNDLFAPPSAAELAQIRPPTDSSADLFAPPTKEELAAASGDQSWFGPGGKVPAWLEKHDTTKGIAKGLLESAPALGAVGGAAVGGGAGLIEGAPTGGLASPYLAAAQGVAGAGLGAGAGKDVENLGKIYLLGEKMAPEEEARRIHEATTGGVLAETGGRTLQTGLQEAAETPLGQKVGQWTGKKASDIGSKIGEALTGASKQEIKTYAGNADKINAMARSSDNNVAQATNDVRSENMDKIQNFKKQQYSAIDAAVENADPSKRYDVTPLIEKLEAQKDLYHPNANKGAINSIQDLQDNVLAHTPGESVPQYGKGVYARNAGPEESPLFPDTAKPDARYGIDRQYGVTPKASMPMDKIAADQSESLLQSLDGSRSELPSTMKVGMDHPPGYQAPVVNDKTVGAKDLNRIKNYLQGEADGAYSVPGEIFNPSSPKARAAQKAAADARLALNDAHPDIAAANGKLSELHEIEDLLNKNMLAEGKSHSGLLAAGNGGNQQNEIILKRLDKLVGTNLSGDAQNLAAMRTFGSPRLAPISSAGTTSTSRSMIGPGVGYAAGHFLGGEPGGYIGAMVGGAATSPAVLKTAINAGLVAKDVAGNIITTDLGRSAMGQGLLRSIMGGEDSQKQTPNDEMNGLISTPANYKEKKKASGQ